MTLVDTNRAPQHDNITDLQSCESQVTIAMGDVAFSEDARLISATAKLDGVLHAAGVLRDAVLHKQTATSFREVLAGKVRDVLYEG